MALDAEDATALGYLFSNVSFPGASSVAPLRCTRATPAGAPLFAIPWAKCWTQEAAERCPEVEAALTVAGRRNPSCELLHRSSTWIVLHLLFESQTTPAPVQHVLRVTETGAQPLMFWAEEELQELRGSYWHQEALRRKEQLRLEYLELQEELGDEVSQRLGLSASGFLKAHMALLLAGLDFGDKGFVLLPGLQGTPSSTSQTTKRTELSADELSAAQGLQLLPMPGCGPVLVATARTSYAAGDLVEIFHRGQCLGSGCSLATFGSLPWCSAWEEVIVTLRLGPEVLEMGAVDFAQTAGQLEEALQRDLRERPPVQRAGLPLRPSPLGTGAVVRREGEDGAWEVRVSLDLQGPSSRSLQLLGLLSLMDLKKRKDMMMLECAWDDVMGEAACEHRGRRVLEEAIRRTLEQLPRPSLARATATERESMCIQLLENERKVLEGALEVQHAALSAASPPAPPVPTMRAYQPSVEPLLEVLQTLKARFQAQEHLPELQGQQLSEELSVTVALLLSDGQLGLELTDPTNESEKKSPIEVLALEALLAQKLWQESKDSKVSRLLEVGALRFRLGDFAIALHDLTLVVEQEPANKEAVRLLERCEKEVAREVQEKAGYLYSLEWSDGEDASVVEALESERLRELQELSTTEAPNTPHAQRLRAVHLDRLGARRLGLRLRELVNGLEVEEIRDGVVKDWNATASPGERIGVGDKIVKVNQVRGSGRMLLAEFRKDQVLHLLVAPPGDDIVASEASNKVPPRAEELTWQDLSLQQLLGWSPPGLCDWQWHETPLQQATGLGPWKMAVVQLDGCTWTSEVDEVFMTSLECQERISFPSKSCLAKLQSLDLILVPLLLDEEVEELSELCEEVRRFLAELQEMDPFARIVALTCGSNGPDCFGARDDGFGMPAAAPARGMFRCFRLEHPETPILHIDTDAVGPGKTAELEAQIRRELTWRYNTQQASDLAFLGREVAYRRQRRFVPQLDVCRQAPARKRACLQRTGVALITGGTGGLGLTTAEVLVDAGVRHVVLCSRSGKVSADAPGQLMERLEGLQRTATVVLEACDAADEDQVLAMLQKLRTNYGPLRWVVNAAGIVRPSDTAEELKAVFQPKCLGAWHLHRHTLEDDLEAMWFFSSLSGGIGTEGLYNYAAANTYLDELAHVRRSAGLPATSIQFPEVEEAGMAAAYLGGGGGSATVSLSVVKLALRQLLLGDGPRASPVVALLPPGYLIARSVYHWLALEPLEKRRNKELWDLLAQTEKENKEEIRELRKELKTRRAEAATR